MSNSQSLFVPMRLKMWHINMQPKCIAPPGSSVQWFAVLLMLYLHLQGKVGATCGLIITEAREPRIVNLKPPASIYSLSTINSTQHRATKVLTDQTSQQKIERIFIGLTPSTTISLRSISIYLLKGHLLRISFHLLFWRNKVNVSMTQSLLISWYISGEK